MPRTRTWEGDGQRGIADPPTHQTHPLPIPGREGSVYFYKQKSHASQTLAWDFFSVLVTFLPSLTGRGRGAGWVCWVFLLCLRFTELVLANAAERAFEVLGQVLKSRAGFDASLGHTYFGIVLPTAYVTNILCHNRLVFVFRVNKYIVSSL